MPLWGSQDAASNSTIFAPRSVKVRANTANRNALFDNTTPDAYITGITVGQFGVDDNEVAANPGINHTGWNLRTEGSGGRAGRVFFETLVAGGITTDASDDTQLPDYILSITSDPANTSGNSTANQTKTFTVAASSRPSGATLSYLWYYSTNGGTSYSTTAAVSGFTNQTTATVSVNTGIITANVLVKAVVSATGAASVNSAAAKLTVTT